MLHLGVDVLFRDVLIGKEPLDLIVASVSRRLAECLWQIGFPV